VESVCVFCGSSPGARSSYGALARDLGTALAARGVRLVYGGASVGLMASVADAALAAGGTVIGVVPERMADIEITHQGLTELRVTGSMHQRKAVMAELSDGFVALPGGFGTLDELTEMVTWAQLGIQEKPCGLLDVDGFFASLLAFFDHCVAEGFVTAPHRALLTTRSDPAELLDALERWEPTAASKWTG